MEGNCYSVLRIEDEGGKALTLYRAIRSHSRGRNEVQGHGVMARALELWIRPRQAGLPSTAVCAPFCNGAVTQRTNCTVTGPGWGPCWAAWAKAEEGVGAATRVSFSLGKPVPKSAGRIGSEPGSPAEKPGTRRSPVLHKHFSYLAHCIVGLQESTRKPPPCMRTSSLGAKEEGE